MDLAKALRLVVVSLLVSFTPLVAQEPIDPVSRSASISAFADGEQMVRFDRLYRMFESEVAQGSAPGSTARSTIVAGPRGDYAFGVSSRLDVTATDAGRATALCTDVLVFVVSSDTPFTLSSAFRQRDRVGAAAAGGLVKVEIVSEGRITLRDGSVVSQVTLRASDRAGGSATSGTLAPGEYRLSVEFSANAAAVGGDAMTDLDAQAWFTTSCRADLSADGTIDLFDFLDFQTLFAAGDPRADFTDDGTFDIFDFLDFLVAFDSPC